MRFEPTGASDEGGCAYGPRSDEVRGKAAVSVAAAAREQFRAQQGRLSAVRAEQPTESATGANA